MKMTDDAALRARVGAALREARLARGLTQGQLAGPYTGAFVCRVEHGDAIPSLRSLQVLTSRLSLSLSEFFDLVESTAVVSVMEQAAAVEEGCTWPTPEPHSHVQMADYPRPCRHRRCSSGVRGR